QLQVLQAFLHVAGAALGRIHEINSPPDHRPDDGLEQRIVRAAQDERVDATPAKRRQVFAQDFPRDAMIGPTFLNQRDEERTSPGEDFYAVTAREQPARVSLAANGGTGSDHPDSPAGAAVQRRTHTWEDYAEDGHFKPSFQGRQGPGRSRVTRHHY